jgi:hypothetical protein
VLAFQFNVAECCADATPVPDKLTVAGDPVALLAMVTIPVTLPAEDGLNCTPIVNFWDGESVTGVPAPLRVNPAPAMLIPEIVTLAFPVSVIVTFCVAAFPVVRLPKLKLDALNEIVAVAAIPFPLNATMLGEVGALLTIDTLPVTLPAVCGAN